MNENGFFFGSILLLVVIIGILILTLFFSLKAIRHWLDNHLSWKRNLFFAGGYLAILILLVPLSYLLPRQGFIQEDTEKNQLSLNSSEDIVTLFSSEDNPDQIKGIYKNKNQIFKVDSETHKFQIAPNQFSYQFLIKRKAVDDGEVEVSSYTTEQYLGDFNYAKEISAPTIDLQNGLLSIQPVSHHKTLEFKQFITDFTVDQFKHVNPKSIEPNRSPDWNFIYLRIPKSLEIGGSSGNVHLLK